MKRDSSVGKLRAHKQKNMGSIHRKNQSKIKQKGKRKNILMLIILLLEKWRQAMSWTSLTKQLRLVVELLDNRRPCLKKKMWLILRKNTQACPVTYTYTSTPTCIHSYFHKYYRKKNQDITTF